MHGAGRRREIWRNPDYDVGEFWGQTVQGFYDSRDEGLASAEIEAAPDIVQETVVEKEKNLEKGKIEASGGSLARREASTGIRCEAGPRVRRTKLRQRRTHPLSASGAWVGLRLPSVRGILKTAVTWLVSIAGSTPPLVMPCLRFGRRDEEMPRTSDRTPARVGRKSGAAVCRGPRHFWAEERRAARAGWWRHGENGPFWLCVHW